MSPIRPAGSNGPRPGPLRRPAVVIVGSQSRAGRAITRSVTRGEVIGICRRPQLSTEKRVASYLAATPEVIPQGSTVVLCVGISTGDAETIRQANVEAPLAWANAAKAAGASHVVQLSSFAVYGGAEEIGRCTPERPAGVYGDSKLLADRSLAALADDRFAVTILRVPMLFSCGGDDKLASLIAALRKVRVIPMPRPPIRRSMLDYEGLGEVVADIVAGRIDGVLHAAEPLPFSWSLVVRVMRQNGLEVFELPVPRSLTGLLRLIAPKIHARLFRSSVLDPQINIARRSADGIEEAIASVLRSRHR